MTIKKSSLSLWALLGMLAISGAAQADESAYSQQHAGSALAAGVGRSTARVLKRGSVDQSATATALAAGFGDAFAATSALPDGTALLAIKDWRIAITTDGTAAHGYRLSDAAPPASTKLDLATLERLGRAFIADQLSKVVSPQPGEQIVVLRSIYEIQSGQDMSGRRDPDLVRANRVVFGREIDRLRVVGGGSTISITFGNDGAPLGFEYDWPSYAVTATLPIASPAAVVGRVQRVAAVRAGGAVAQAALPRVDASRGYPAALAQGLELSRLECGYFDPGAFTKLGSDIVQPACKYEVMHSQSVAGHVLRHGLGGAVPAAINAVPDERWPELQLLSGASSSAPAPGAATH